MKYILYYIVLLASLSGCGGGGTESSNNSNNGDSDEENNNSNKSARVNSSVADAKENAQAVRDFFYRNGGVSSRKLAKKTNTETSQVNCTTGHIKQTKFTETEYEKYDYNYDHQVLSKEFFNCIKDPDSHLYIKGNDIYNDTYNGSLENTYTATTKNLETGGHDRNIWEYATVYNNFQIKHKNKAKNHYYGMWLIPSSIQLNVEFDTEVDAVTLNGQYYSKIIWKNRDKDISFATGEYKIPDAQFFEIIGNDATGTRWTKMDISHESEMISTNKETGEYKKGEIKTIIKTDNIIIKQACSNQYEIRTITPFITLVDNEHPSKGEMTIYNNTNDVLTKLSVIDEENVELSADFDKDGIIDYKKTIKWSDVLNNPGSDNICR